MRGNNLYVHQILRRHRKGCTTLWVNRSTCSACIPGLLTYLKGIMLAAKERSSEGIPITGQVGQNHDCRCNQGTMQKTWRAGRFGTFLFEFGEYNLPYVHISASRLSMWSVWVRKWIETLVLLDYWKLFRESGLLVWDIEQFVQLEVEVIRTLFYSRNCTLFTSMHSRWIPR